LLQVVVCCKSFPRRVLRKRSKDIEITGHRVANMICDSLRNYSWEVMDRPFRNLDPAPSDLHILVSLIYHYDIPVSKYEGWNFNSGNYLFTTNTK